MTAAVVQHINNYGQINTPDHQWMRFRQHLQVLVFEEPGLSFIMNFFKIHITSFSTANIALK